MERLSLVPYSSLSYTSFTIRITYQDHVLPGVFVLMDSKSERAYLDVFTTLQLQMRIEHQLGQEYFSIDFELAAFNAFKSVFPNATEAFCFFHFAQSM